MHRDHNPIFGSQNRLESHVSCFFEWAAERSLLTIGRCIEAITFSNAQPLLLSGPLAFLARTEVADVLDAWVESTNNGFVWELRRLSRALTISFPELRVPSPTQPIKDRLHGHLETGYLGAMLATRQAPDLAEDQQDGLNCLRLWVFVKALEFARDGHPAEGNVQTACDDIRAALDLTDPSRRVWLCGVAKPNTSYQAFEDNLAYTCKQRPPGEPPISRGTRGALKNLAEGKKRKATFDPAGSQQLLATLNTELWHEASRPNIKHAQYGVIFEGGDEHQIFSLPEGAFLAARVSPRDNPDRQIAKSARFVLQTVEDRQFLPCSWLSVRPDEQELLTAAIESNLRSPSPANALIAAFVVLAMVTRSSLNRIGQLALGTELEPDWTLDLDAGHLKRQPARPPVRWRQSAQNNTWTSPLSKEWRFELQPRLLEILRSARLNQPNARQLGALWTFQETPYVAFRALCRETPGLERVSSKAIGMLGERRSYVENFDATYARLVMSPSTAGIAGAGSYASWPLKQPVDTLQAVANGLIQSSASSVDQELNGLGSELDPDDIKLREALSEAANKLELPDPDGNWITHHNHLTAYVVAVLFACTGGRPSNSPFESISHFDLERRRAYIEDKATAQMADGMHGRIVPLPGLACELLSQIYLPYLLNLAEQLLHNERELAQEILAQAKGEGSSRLPLFFFLRARPAFAWLEVSESALNELGGFTWPLPWNLFRHRMAIRLRAVKLDPELIDAQLGHAEVGSETFGDTSTRCWEDDEPVWRRALDHVVERLSIRRPNLRAAKVTAEARAPDYRPFRETSSFGREARRADREKSRERARRQAADDIQQMIGDRMPESLTGEQWDAIGRSMLLQEGNLPHSNAAIRYDVFERFVRRQWHEKALHIHLTRRYIKFPAPRAGHHSGAIHATQSLTAVRARLDEAFKRPPSLQSNRNASLLAALDLCLTSRVADLDILNALVSADNQRIRLVIESNTAYLEFHEKKNTFEELPCRRYLVPARSAPLISKALASHTKIYRRTDETDDVQAILLALPHRHAAPDREKLLEQVVRLVDLENSLTLPGLFGAVLAGRTLTYALSHADWIRAKHGERRVPKTLPREATSEPAIASGSTTPNTSQDELSAYPGTFAIATGRQRVTASKADHDFLRKVRRLLRHLAGDKVGLMEFEGIEAVRRLKKSTTDSASRAAAKEAIRILLTQASPQTSGTVRLLVAWTTHLLERKSRRRGGKLAPRSILRYLGALSRGFVSYGRNVDLRAMTESQITDLYLNVIDATLSDRSLWTTDDQDESELNDSEIDVDPTEEESSAENELDDSQQRTTPSRRRGSKVAQTYVLERLVEFHRFASGLLDLVDPDWSEIGDGLSASTVSPGFITPAEYLKASELLCKDPVRATSFELMCGYLLLLTYRFGLRSGEAIALAVSDWVEVKNSVVVLVNRAHAALKTKGSRRQVPLIGELTAHERLIVDTWKTHWQTETRDNRSIPYFFRHPLSGGVADVAPLRHRIVEVLRLVTGIPDLTLHKARHSFANVLAAHVLRPDTPLRWEGTQFVGVSSDETSTRHAEVVVGHHRPTRRRLWSISRALGHSMTATTCGSYLHVLGDMCSQKVSSLSPKAFPLQSRKGLDKAVNLDEWAPDEGYLNLEVTPVDTTPTALKPSVVIQYMRAVARGVLPTAAQHRLNIGLSDVTRLQQAILDVACRARDKSPLKVTPADELTIPFGFLKEIRPSRWDQLLDASSTLSGLDASPMADPFGQVGGGFQVLAFKRGHFENIRAFLIGLGWGAQDVRLFKPQRLEPQVETWAQSLGHELRATHENDIKKFQLSVGREYSVDAAPATRRDRVSLVRSSANRKVESQVELATLWLAFWVSSPSH